MVLDDLDSLVPSEAQGVLREKLRTYVLRYVSRQRVRMLHDQFQIRIGHSGTGSQGPLPNLPTHASAYVRGMKVRGIIGISGAPRIPDP